MRLRDISQAMPFDNPLIVMRLNGAQLKRLMADNLRGGWSAVQVSGLRVKFRPGPGGKPSEIRLERDGREIKPGEEFLVVTNNYLAFGGNGGGVFAEGGDIKDSMLPVRDVMIKAFSKGPAAAPARGRIVRLK